MKYRILAILFVTLITGGIAFFVLRGQPMIASFEECARRYAVAESYPRQCTTPDGKHFVEDIGNELEKTNLIRLISPRPNDLVANPLIVSGEARGNWFFEASFPIELLDDNKKVIATGIAQAEGEWMTTEFVPFKATLQFIVPIINKGELRLHKDNPSGLPEYDDVMYIPIRFR